MGLVLPIKRLISASLEDRPRHNASSIDLAGLDRNQVKRLIHRSQDLGHAERAFLSWAADASANYVICVKTARDELGFGKALWASTKKKLVSRGILAQMRAILPDGSSHWTLSIDFAPLMALARAHARDGRVSDPHARACDPPKLAHYPNKKNTPRRPPQGAGGNVVDAGQPSQPRPDLQLAPPAPRGAGGCVRSPQGAIPEGQEFDEEKMTGLDKFENFSPEVARKFFDWLAENDVTRVRLAVQTRKKDGQRGAPLGFGRPGKPIAEGLPVATLQAADLAVSLLARLESPSIGKTRLELVTAAAEDSRGGAKSILVDDLDADGVQRVAARWRGPGAILETSPSNFQAVLILSEPLGREDRKSITDQLVGLAGGDKGAKGSQQLHRLPGSVNYKRSLPAPFVCRLVNFFTGTGEGVASAHRPVPVARRASSTVVMPSNVRPLRPLRWKSPAASDSEAAFRLAADMARSGASDDQIKAVLSAPEVLRGHDPDDWPKRTLERARLFLAGGLYGRGGARHA